MTHQPQRRVSTRTRLDGLARLDVGKDTYSFRIADVSYCGLGLGLHGEVPPLRVGSVVRVMLTLSAGRKPATCPCLETWAVVRRVGATGIGLDWSPSTTVAAEQIIYLVEGAAGTAAN